MSTVPAPERRVLVTGVAGGLGRALAAGLTEVGTEFVGIDLPRTDAAVTADLTDDCRVRPDRSGHTTSTRLTHRLRG